MTEWNFILHEKYPGMDLAYIPIYLSSSGLTLHQAASGKYFNNHPIGRKSTHNNWLSATSGLIEPSRISGSHQAPCPKAS